MPPIRTPSYRLHKPSGLGVVRLGGRDIYLGRHNTPASIEAYHRVLAEWHAGGHRCPVPKTGVTVGELVLAYVQHAERYYVIDGQPTGEARGIRNALRYLADLYADTAGEEFGPLALKAVRQRMVDAGLARHTVNAYVGKIKGMFRWAVAGELLPSRVYEALRSVQGLAPGRSAATDRPEVAPVPLDVYEATVACLRPRAADVCRVIRLTGCRPGEACALRGADIDTSPGDAWVWSPRRHKTAHRGKHKVVVIGPAAVAALSPYLIRAGGGYLFPGRKPGRPLTELALAAAVRAAAERAGQPHWTPNQLRHLRATEIRARWGAEAARAVLDHDRLSTTEIYAERDLSQALRIMREIG